MVDQAQVGPQSAASIGVNTITNLRSGQLGDLIVQDLHGRYYENTYRGNMFSVAAQAVLTTTTGLATTYTGLCVSNPVGSPVNLAVNKCTMMQSVVQSVQVEAYGLAVGFNLTTNVTHSTSATPQSNLAGSGLQSNAKADTSAGLPTAPLYYAFVTNTGTATADSVAVSMIDLEGSLILKPGAYVLWVTPGQASVAGLWFSISWEEVPV